MAMTENQLKAVNSEGDILVSAGAGSGKTTVLTSRVLRKVNEGVKLDEFLIVTFTKAASKSMREKIKNALVKNGKGDLLNEVDSAHIDTFDAYALFIVNKYGYSIGLPPTIYNVPQDVIDLKIRKTIDDIFNEYYEKEDPLFVDFISTYCFKNDNILKEFVMDFYQNANQQLDINEYLNNYCDEYLSDKALNEKPSLYVTLVKQEINNLLTKANGLSEKYSSVILDSFVPILSAKNDAEFFEEAKHYVFPKMIIKDPNDKAIRNDIRDTFKNKIKVFFGFDEDIYKKFDITYEKKFIPLVINIVQELAKQIYKFEVEKRYFTFEEIAHLSYRILKENPDIRNEVKNSIKLIFIDEYQDTSDLQDKFISLISSNNVFSVGDVKQSIYLFRGANPSNFITKYGEYKKVGKAIDMNDNFRSRKEVVSKINDIFNKIMTEKRGGADYSVSHNLNAKNSQYENEGKVDSQHGVVYLKFEKGHLIDAIIKNIQTRIANHEQIYDRDEKKVRDIEYRDFAILSYGKSKFPDYEEALRSSNIPVTAIYDEPILNDSSIVVLVSLLNAISLINKKSLSSNEQVSLKHFYISVVRSFLCEYSDKMIYEQISTNTYLEDPIYVKLRNFAFDHKLSDLSTIYTDLLEEFDFIYRLNRLPNPFASIRKIEMFYARVKIMDDLGYSTDDFINYLNDLNKYSIEMDATHDEESDNSVKLTTIHKSKGLEYKIVYLVDLYNKGQPDKKKSMVDTKYGVWLPSFSFPSTRPIEYYISDLITKNKYREEKMRLLYVALTRAEDTCVLLINSFNQGARNVLTCITLMDYLEASNVSFDEDYYSTLDTPIVVGPKKAITKKTGMNFGTITASFEKSIIKTNASKDINYDVPVDKLFYGTHMHLLMEEVDFKTKDTSFIKNDFEKKVIDRVIHNNLFDNLDDANLFKEYQFEDVENQRSGIIDLLMVYKDKAIVVDYKLKHISDDAYKNQLKVYKDFVEEKFKIPCKCYLLSLIDDETKEVF